MGETYEQLKQAVMAGVPLPSCADPKALPRRHTAAKLAAWRRFMNQVVTKGGQFPSDLITDPIEIHPTCRVYLSSIMGLFDLDMDLITESGYPSWPMSVAAAERRDAWVLVETPTGRLAVYIEEAFRRGWRKIPDARV